MPTTEYTISGHHRLFGDVKKIRYTKSQAEDVATVLKKLGYAVAITERSLAL